MIASRRLHLWSTLFVCLAFVGRVHNDSDVLFAAVFVSAVIIGTAGDVLKAFGK